MKKIFTIKKTNIKQAFTKLVLKNAHQISKWNHFNFLFMKISSFRNKYNSNLFADAR